MSKKPNKTRTEPVMDPAETLLRKRAFYLSIALIVVSACKVLATIFFDLGAITHFTGQLNPDLAVQSGMGRICFAGGLVLFMSGAYGLGLREAAAPTLKNARLLAIIAAVCGVAMVAIGIVDGHNLTDVVSSLAGAVIAAFQAQYIRQIQSL